MLLNRLTAALCSLLLLSCGGQEPPQTDGAPPSEPAAEAEESQATDPQDDPDNPWVFGYRWSAPPGTSVQVQWATRDGQYEARKEAGAPRPYGTAEFNHEGSEESGAVLATVFIQGLKLRAEIRSGAGPVTIEMIRGRAIDPADPMGGVEVKEVLASEQASGEGGIVLLAVGESFEEAPSHW